MLSTLYETIRRRRRGMTLVELLIVIIVIAILAALVLVRFSDIKEGAYVDAMKNDLRNLATVQELQVQETDSYAADLSALPGYALSDDVMALNVQATGGEEWLAVLGHNKTKTACALAVGPVTRNTLTCAKPSEFLIPVSDENPIAGVPVTFGADDLVQAASPVAFMAPLYAADPSEIQSLDWNFGDGETLTGTYGEASSVSHAFAQACHTYGVTLVATRVSGQKEMGFRTIKTQCEGEAGSEPETPPANQAPSASFTFAPDSPLAGEEVSFDGSLSSDADGSIVSYAWDFGDGAQGSTASAAHAFISEGDYTVSLVVTDDIGDVDTASQVVTVSSIPNTDPQITSFSRTPSSPAVAYNAEITFETVAVDPDQGQTITAVYDFGDGAEFANRVGASTSAAHTYDVVGSWTASVTVSDGAGGSATESIAVQTTNASPSADFSMDIAEPVEEESVTFDASSSTDPENDIVSYAWNFGDGFTASGAVVEHAFSTADTYTVELTVTDGANGTDSHSVEVTVVADIPAWTLLPRVGSGNVVSLAVVSPTQAYVSNSDGRIYRWNGTSWNSIVQPYTSGQISVASSGNLIYKSGNMVNIYSSSGNPITYWPNLVSAASYGDWIYQGGYTYQYNGATNWAQRSYVWTAYNATQMWAGDGVIAVIDESGTNPTTGMVVNAMNGAGQGQGLNASGVQGIDGSSSSNIVAATEFFLYRYNGSSWAYFTPPRAGRSMADVAVTPTGLWAVGSMGLVVFSTDISAGFISEELAGSASTNFTAVDAAGGAVFVGGTAGKVYMRLY